MIGYGLLDFDPFRILKRNRSVALLLGLSLIQGVVSEVRADAVKPRGTNVFQMVTGNDTEENRSKWDQIFNKKEYVYGREPSDFLKDNIALLPVGRSLDIAMGEGRNGVFLAKKGFVVDGMDISQNALRKANQLAWQNHVTINTMIVDVGHFTIKPETYDVILNIDFLQRSLIPEIKRGLKHGGVVVFENRTLEQIQNVPGRQLNPDELLKKGELKEAFKDFQVLIYREQNDGKDAWARLIARKP